jgi:hypothetical protein
MSFEIIISKINRELISAFATLDSWFDRPVEMLHERSSSRWTPAEILEHVMLTNHYLLILIEKGSKRALARANDHDLSQALTGYSLETHALESIGKHGSFSWARPEHMEPTGSKSLEEIRKELRDQLYRCLYQLELLCEGQGVTYRLTMSVNGTGKLDVYQYIYFLALHAKRHITQLEKVKAASVWEWPFHI